MEQCTPRKTDGRKNKYVIESGLIMGRNESRTKSDENLIFRRLSEASWVYSHEIF